MSIAEPPDRGEEELQPDGDIDDDPAVDRPPPVEWVERHFPDDTSDIDDDTHDDVEEVEIR